MCYSVVNCDCHYVIDLVHYFLDHILYLNLNFFLAVLIFCLVLHSHTCFLIVSVIISQIA